MAEAPIPFPVPPKLTEDPDAPPLAPGASPVPDGVPLVTDDRLQPDGSMLSIGRIPDYVRVKCAKCGQRTAEVSPEMPAAAAEKALCALCFKVLVNQAGTPAEKPAQPVRMTFKQAIEGDQVARHGPALPLLIADMLASMAEQIPQEMLENPLGCAGLSAQGRVSGLVIAVLIQPAPPPTVVKPEPPKEEPSRIIVARRKRIGSRAR